MRKLLFLLLSILIVLHTSALAVDTLTISTEALAVIDSVQFAGVDASKGYGPTLSMEYSNRPLSWP